MKRIYRSRQNKVIAGVCGGIGEYFNIDPVLIRVLFVLLVLLQGFGILAYIIAWIIIPKNPVQKDKDTKISKKASEVESRIAKTASKFSNKDRKALGIILIIIGILLSIGRFIFIDFRQYFPILFILIGIVLLIKD